MKPILRLLCISVLCLPLTACFTIGNAKRPIASILVPATKPGMERTLIVVLPGFGNDAKSMQKHDIGKAVHQRWAEADVLLTSATFAYYKERNIVERLQQDIIAPARAQGYQHIWLAGASIGGMGVLFYEHEHPGEMDGLVLLAPWLGDSDMLDEIRKAGGVSGWEPGPLPATVDGDNYQRELWRVVKRWSQDPAEADRVWLICGTDDRMFPTARLIEPVIPASHSIEVPGGGHDWKTFVTATDQIIGRIRGAPIDDAAHRSEP